MKRISFGFETLITSDKVAAALVKYAAQVVRHGTSEAVDLPVLESNGEVTIHTILLGPATQLAVADVDGARADNPDFPVPTFPPLHPAVAHAVEPGEDIDLP